MRPEVEELTIKQVSGIGGRDQLTITHPAFAQIGASRSSGGNRSLYDSDFVHNNVVTIRISRSVMHRHLSNDWHHPKEEYIEVALSEAQWATFVATPNSGSGVPCTLVHRNGERTPYLPEPASRTQQFGEEMKRTLQESLDTLKAMQDDVDNLGISKKKAEELKHKLRVAHDKLKGNAPFVANQFDEHMETTVERGKAEVHGYLTGVVHAAGIKALGDEPLLRLGSKEEDIEAE